MTALRMCLKRHTSSQGRSVSLHQFAAAPVVVMRSVLCKQAAGTCPACKLQVTVASGVAVTTRNTARSNDCTVCLKNKQKVVLCCFADRHSGGQLQSVQPYPLTLCNDHQPFQDALQHCVLQPGWHGLLRWRNRHQLGQRAVAGAAPIQTAPPLCWCYDLLSVVNLCRFDV